MLYFIIIVVITTSIQVLVTRAEIKFYKQLIDNYKKETDEICI